MFSFDVLPAELVSPFGVYLTVNGAGPRASTIRPKILRCDDWHLFGEDMGFALRIDEPALNDPRLVLSMNRSIWIAREDIRSVRPIGIGRSLAAPPSHTTGRTDHVSGGSMN